MGGLQVVQEKGNMHGGKFLLGNPETMGHGVSSQGATRVLLLITLQMRLSWHPEAPFLELNLLGRKGKGEHSQSLLFSNKQLKINLPKRQRQVAKLWFPLLVRPLPRNS